MNVHYSVTLSNYGRKNRPHFTLVVTSIMGKGKVSLLVSGTRIFREKRRQRSEVRKRVTKGEEKRYIDCKRDIKFT